MTIANKAMSELVKIGAPATKPLVDAIKSKRLHNIALERAAEVLGQIKDPNAIELLIEAMKYNSYCKDEVEYILATMGIYAVEPLINALQNEQSTEIQVMIVKLLGYIGGERAVEPLIYILGDVKADMNIKKSAIQALGQVRDVRAVDPLIDILNNTDDYRFSEYVVKALGQINDVRSIEPIFSVLNSAVSSDIANVVLEALSNMGQPSIDFLTIKLNDNDPIVRIIAMQALAYINKSIIDQRIVILMRDKDPQVRIAAVRLLGQTNDNSAVELLIEALEDNDAIVQKEALIALWQNEDTRAKGAVSLVKQNKPDIIARACDFIISIGQPGTEDFLIQSLYNLSSIEEQNTVRTLSISMAEHFLNSGNSKLENAARTWVMAHGYQIVAAPYGRYSQWGSASGK